FPAILDPGGVPADVLPWLARFFDIVFEPRWPTTVRQKLLQIAPDLLRRRGTIQGLQLAVAAVAQLDDATQVAIQALGASRSWGMVRHDAVLGQVRLFSRSRARFVVGSSPLGGAPLRSYGKIEQDPFLLGAFRFRVSVPASSLDPDRLARLVDSQKPAH